MEIDKKKLQNYIRTEMMELFQLYSKDRTNKSAQGSYLSLGDVQDKLDKGFFDIPKKKKGECIRILEKRK